VETEPLNVGGVDHRDRNTCEPLGQYDVPFLRVYDGLLVGS
jgi:hypothetical protein